MGHVPNATYLCSRPKRRKCGTCSIVVEQLFEMPPSWELKAWIGVRADGPMVSVRCSANRAVEGQVVATTIELLNRRQVQIKYEVVGRLVSTVCKGVTKSLATDQS